MTIFAVLVLVTAVIILTVLGELIDDPTMGVIIRREKRAAGKTMRELKRLERKTLKQIGPYIGRHRAKLS